jgi:hypothetical protein
MISKIGTCGSDKGRERGRVRKGVDEELVLGVVVLGRRR